MLVFDGGGVVEEVVVANKQPPSKASIHVLDFDGGGVVVVVEVVEVANKQRRGWRLLDRVVQSAQFEVYLTAISHFELI